MKKQLFSLMTLAVALTSTQVLADDTLAKINASNKVVMGTRESSAPLAYTLGNGKFVGYHVELCENILKKIAPKAKIEYVAVTSANRVQLVQNGTVDLECGSTTNNLARQKDVAFAYTTFLTEVRMAVRANSGITSIAQLNGKNVATTTGTTSVALLRKDKRANGIDFKEIYGKDHADSFLQLEEGRADAFVMDNNILAGLIISSKNPKDYKIVGEPLSTEPIAVMFRKDDPAFRKAVDDAIVTMMKDGSLANIYNKWFMKPIPPTNNSVNMPMSDRLKALFVNPNDNPAEAYIQR